MPNRETKPEDNETPPEQIPAAGQHVSRGDLSSFRKEVLHSFQRITDSMENHRHEMGISLEAIKEEISDSTTKQAVIENRLTMVERIVYGLCAVVGVTIMAAILTLVMKEARP